jgi:hypothetical protein
MRIVLVILFFITLESNAQYYIMAAPNVAFNTPLNDTKNLLGGTVEVGKYFGSTAVGINSGWWTYDSKDFYQEVMATFPVYDKFSVSAAIGYFYYHKDITMEYDLNYTLPLSKEYSFVLSYGAQSAFGGTYGSYSLGINKDFKLKNK